MTEEEIKGYTRAHQAALFAHLRTLIAATLSENDPVTGLHGVAILESGKSMHIAAGATPELPNLLSMLSFAQGKVIVQAVARQLGDLKTAQVGDRYDPELGKARCENCEDGDPTGSHAEEELRLNGKAWLGLTVAVAELFYGKYLSDKATALLFQLKTEALVPDTHVS